MKKPLLITLSLLLLILLATVLAQTTGRAREVKARKFDEFTTGIGSAELRFLHNYDEQGKGLKERMRRFALQIQRERARGVIIGYGPRVVEWEVYNRSVGEMRAGQAAEHLPPFFNYRRVTTIDGGFREIAMTELWVVPLGAQPPQPTPTVSQEDVTYCPFLRINATPYVTKSNAPIEFKAVVEVNNNRVQPTFAWEVSQGKIVSGQGTDSIKVELPADAPGEVVAKVNVIGYSLECPLDSTTTTAKTAFGTSHFKFDEFGRITCEDELARLDNLASTLQSDPALQVHIVIYGGRSGPRNEALARAASMRSYLVQARRIEAGRVITVDGGYRNEWSGEFWLSPRGAGKPVLTPTVDRSYVRLGGRVDIVNSPCSYE